MTPFALRSLKNVVTPVMVYPPPTTFNPPFAVTTPTESILLHFVSDLTSESCGNTGQTSMVKSAPAPTTVFPLDCCTSGQLLLKNRFHLLVYLILISDIGFKILWLRFIYQNTQQYS